MSSPAELTKAQRCARLAVDLLELAERTEAAGALALALDARELIPFVFDAEVEAWMPAQGFPQALPGGPAWAELVRRAHAGEPARALLSTRADVPEEPVAAVRAGARCVVALVGCNAELRLEPLIRSTLELLGHGLACEHEARMARAGADLSRASALQAHSLAMTVDRVRHDLERAVHAEQRRSRNQEELAGAARVLGVETSPERGLELLAHRSCAVLNAWLVAATLTSDAGAVVRTAMSGSIDAESAPVWTDWLCGGPLPAETPAVRLGWQELEDTGRRGPQRVGYLAVGMRDRAGRAVGYLRAGSRPGTEFDADHEAMAVQLGQIGAATIENALLMERAVASEKIARTQLELLQAIAASLGEGVMAFDAAGRITFTNRMLGELLACSGTDLLGRDAHEVLHPACRAASCPLRTSATLDATVHRFDLEIQRSDGTHFPASCALGPIVADGVLLGLVLAITDVGEQRQLEESLRLRQKLESIGLLAGGIAHDFNNLLTPVLGNAALMADALPQQDPLQEPLHEIVIASERAAHLTRQLLAYAGKGRFTLRTLDVSQEVRDLAPLLYPAMPPGAALELELSPGPCLVLADPGQLHQILMNLVLNAAEAMDPSRVGRVVIRTGEATLSAADLTAIGGDPLSQAQPGRYASIEVADNGTGMDEPTRARIFEPFFTTKFTGRGLGLAAVVGVVRSHSGRIHVESKRGSGSTFRVYLPLGAPVPAAPVPPDPEPHRDVGTVLIVDDEPSVRRFIAKILKAHDYTVIEASNGQEAVDLAASVNVDLVILDIAMPVMGGERALEQLSSLHPAFPVLVMSGFHESAGIDRMTARPGVRFLPKPATPKAILKAVADLLAQTRDPR